MRIFRIGEVDHPEIAGAKVIAEIEVLPGSEQLQEWPSLLRALQLARERKRPTYRRNRFPTKLIQNL
jgi:hypothetical protein